MPEKVPNRTTPVTIGAPPITLPPPVIGYRSPYSTVVRSRPPTQRPTHAWPCSFVSPVSALPRLPC